MSSNNWNFEPPRELPKEGRTCQKCGWYYPPSSYAVRECKWCHTPLEVQVCKYCGRPISVDEAYRLDTDYIARVCSLCEKQVHNLQRRVVNSRAFMTKLSRIRRLNAEYDKFVKYYKSKVKNKRLSIREVNSIVDRRHLGCAICHGDIQTHIQLIPISIGGLYEPCNVIPVCEEHNTLLSYDYNPLMATDERINKDSSGHIYNEMVRILTKKERWLDDQKY